MRYPRRSPRGDRAPDSGALRALNDALPGVLGALRLVRDGNGYGWCWKGMDRRLDQLLAPIVDSACELLTSGDLHRVRECAAKRCGWLFLDRSRNRTRRWCDMSVCGNRAKARRHYRRKKASAGSGAV